MKSLFVAVFSFLLFVPGSDLLAATRTCSEVLQRSSTQPSVFQQFKNGKIEKTKPDKCGSGGKLQLFSCQSDGFINGTSQKVDCSFGMTCQTISTSIVDENRDTVQGGVCLCSNGKPLNACGVCGTLTGNVGDACDANNDECSNGKLACGSNGTLTCLNDSPCKVVSPVLPALPSPPAAPPPAASPPSPPPASPPVVTPLPIAVPFVSDSSGPVSPIISPSIPSGGGTGVPPQPQQEIIPPSKEIGQPHILTPAPPPEVLQQVVTPPAVAIVVEQPLIAPAHVEATPPPAPVVEEALSPPTTPGAAATAVPGEPKAEEAPSASPPKLQQTSVHLAYCLLDDMKAVRLDSGEEMTLKDPCGFSEKTAVRSVITDKGMFRLNKMAMGYESNPTPEKLAELRKELVRQLVNPEDSQKLDIRKMGPEASLTDVDSQKVGSLFQTGSLEVNPESGAIKVKDNETFKSLLAIAPSGVPESQGEIVHPDKVLITPGSDHAAIVLSADNPALTFVAVLDSSGVGGGGSRVGGCSLTNGTQARPFSWTIVFFSLVSLIAVKKGVRVPSGN